MCSNTDDNFVPVEELLKNMTHIEQYVSKIADFSSRFNISTSSFYSPINLIGKYSKYPSYGDFPETYFLRSYGKWWKESAASQNEYMPQDVDPLAAEDFITLEFEQPVVPRDVCIYETYNPGAVVRIWGKKIRGEFCWVLLWEGPPQDFPAESRKFHPPIRKTNILVSTIRLEFNQSHLRYHTSLDAVLLGGLQPKSIISANMIADDLVFNKQSTRKILNSSTKTVCDSKDEGNNDYFSIIPFEVILHIFQYLDLKSLTRCAQVNRRCYDATLEPAVYQNLNLKRYWYLINRNTLKYYRQRCKSLKKFDFSWCGDNSVTLYTEFKLFLDDCCEGLTHLSMENCKLPDVDWIFTIGKCKELTEVRLKSSTCLRYFALGYINKLVTLDLTSTCIRDNDLILILRKNPDLKHIVLDLCELLLELNRVVEIAVEHNKNLTTWSSWKTCSLTSNGVRLFKHFPNLKELDLGWCLLNENPGRCLEEVAVGCKRLERLIISEWRGLTDQLLLPIINSCKELRQLDLLGIKDITGNICYMALATLPKLRLLDVSFCDNIRPEEVEIWSQQYPHITIQRSCQYVVTDYLN